MNEPKTSTEEILVHLVRPGFGARDYHLPEGATLADLLRLSGTLTTNQAVFVDGSPPEEGLPLRRGAVVTIVPRPSHAEGDEPWRAAVSAFRDEALFQEYSEILKARRQEVASEEGQGGRVAGAKSSCPGLIASGSMDGRSGVLVLRRNGS